MVKRTAAQTLDAVALAEIDQRRQKREGRVLRLARQQLRFAARHHTGKEVAGAHWYCLQVSGGHDFTVEKLLTDCDVEALAPRENVTTIKRGKKFDRERPYFSGYVLVRFAPSDEAFDGIRKQKHVFGFVAGKAGYIVVKDNEMKRFQKLTPSTICRMPTDKSICDGSKARITYGPFANFECVVLAVKWKREGRVRVQVDCDGRQFEIADMPLAFLEKL